MIRYLPFVAFAMLSLLTGMRLVIMSLTQWSTTEPLNHFVITFVLTLVSFAVAALWPTIDKYYL